MDSVIRGRLAGISLIVAAVFEVFAMAHHPTITTPNIVDAIQQIRRARQLDGLVHGVLMALLLIVLYGLSEFILRRDVSRPAIRAGLIAYGSGVLFMLGAGTVSGFILPDVLSLTPHTSATDLDINLQVIFLCRALNQSCANFATVGYRRGSFSGLAIYCAAKPDGAGRWELQDLSSAWFLRSPSLRVCYISTFKE